MNVKTRGECESSIRSCNPPLTPPSLAFQAATLPYPGIAGDGAFVILHFVGRFCKPACLPDHQSGKKGALKPPHTSKTNDDLYILRYAGAATRHAADVRKAAPTAAAQHAIDAA